MVVVIGVVGAIVTVLVIAGMIMLVPSRTEELRSTPSSPAGDGQGSELSPRDPAAS